MKFTCGSVCPCYEMEGFSHEDGELKREEKQLYAQTIKKISLFIGEFEENIVVSLK